MSKVTLALGSFIVGAVASFVFMSVGNHASTRAQEIFNRKAVPAFPPLPEMASRGNRYAGVSVDLDGVNSVEDAFDNATIVYGGGAFRLIQPKFSGSVRLTLTGAAANGQYLVTFFQLLASGTMPKPTKPRVPIQEVHAIKQQITADCISPFGQR